MHLLRMSYADTLGDFLKKILLGVTILQRGDVNTKARVQREVTHAKKRLIPTQHDDWECILVVNLFYLKLSQFCFCSLFLGAEHLQKPTMSRLLIQGTL